MHGCGYRVGPEAEVLIPQYTPCQHETAYAKRYFSKPLVRGVFLPSFTSLHCMETEQRSCQVPYNHESTSPGETPQRMPLSLCIIGADKAAIVNRHSHPLQSSEKTSASLPEQLANCLELAAHLIDRLAVATSP